MEENKETEKNDSNEDMKTEVLKETSPKLEQITNNDEKNLIKKEIENIKQNSNENKLKENTPQSVNNIENLKIKPKKELPIEKKPFNEFVNEHLIPSLIDEFKKRGREIKNISLKNTTRPIAGDKCWVIYCEVKDTCNFWLSFDNEDITSSKSISLSKSTENPSVLESFLVDEKRITMQLIISRILQRLNGQKLMGDN